MLAGAGIAVHMLPAARPHSPARVRGPAPGRRGRGHDHGEPQSGGRQRVQAVPGRRRSGHPARRRRDRGADGRSRATVAGSGRAAWAVRSSPATATRWPGRTWTRWWAPQPSAARAGQACAAGPRPAGRRSPWSTRRCTGWRGDLMLRAMSQAGFAAPHVVAAQARARSGFPDGRVSQPGGARARWTWPWPTPGGSAPTWCWPATRTGTGWPWPSAGTADEADGWVVLTGDQLGSLLGASTAGPDGGRRRGRPGGWSRPRSFPRRCCPRSPRRPGRIRRDADRVQVDRPGGRRRAGRAVRVRLRGGARLRGRRRGARQGRHRRRAGHARGWPRRRRPRGVRYWTATTNWRRAHGVHLTVPGDAAHRRPGPGDAPAPGRSPGRARRRSR